MLLKLLLLLNKQIFLNGEVKQVIIPHILCIAGNRNYTTDDSIYLSSSAKVIFLILL